MRKIFGYVALTTHSLNKPVCSISSKVKYRVLIFLLQEKELNKCCFCLCHLCKLTATIEHILPKSRGGSNERTTNLTISCLECNGRRGSQDFYVFEAKTIKRPKHIPEQVRDTWLGEVIDVCIECSNRA